MATRHHHQAHFEVHFDISLSTRKAFEFEITYLLSGAGYEF